MTIHNEQRFSPYRADQLFDLVADVRSYPEFLPWCLAVRIKSQTEDHLTADLIIGFQLYKEQFTSHVSLDREGLAIDVEYRDGPFKYLKNHWRFHDHPQGCQISFYIDFEFRSRLLQTLIEGLFTEAVKKMVSAFETRAQMLYAPKLPPI